MPEGTEGQQEPNQIPAENDTLENEVELSEEEKASLEEETSKKFDSVLAQKKHWREKAKKAEEEVAELKKQQQPPPKSEPQEDAIEKAVTARLTKIERDRHLKSVPEDKRKSVQDVFDSLVLGKNIQPEMVEDYMSIALKANDVRPSETTSRIIRSASGAIPSEQPRGPSQEDIEFAKKSGTDPKLLEKIDYSDMMGAERFQQDTQLHEQKTHSII